MIKLNHTKMAVIALGLLSSTACSGGGDPGGETDVQGLVASIELDNGMTVEFHATEYGDIIVEAAAEKSSLEQQESFEQFAEAAQSSMTATELYEEFAGEPAPPELVEAEARMEAAKAASDRDEDADAEAIEEPVVQPAPSSEEVSDGLQPLMSFTTFKDNYCYKDIWGSYYASSERCYGNRTTYLSFTSSSHNKEGTYARVNVVAGGSMQVWHRKKILGDWVIQYKSTIGLNENRWSRSLGSSAQRNIMTVLGVGTKYHIRAAILESD